MSLRVLVAPDKFRGTLAASDAADRMCAAATHHGDRAVAIPLADGGEGTVAVFGGPTRWTSVIGPLGEIIDAPWRLDGEFAVIEIAAASGLAIVGDATQNDPVAATTRGTGELIARAIDDGARHVIVGLGGSATTDGGIGALEVLSPYAPLGGIGASVAVEVACDVRTRFIDAAREFAPQKGADPQQVELLRARLIATARDLRERWGVDVTTLDGSGAAGGLAGGLAALGAQLRSGFGLVAELLGLEEAILEADLVVTGEGRVDATSFEGKVVGGVLELAARHGVPALVIAGAIAGPLPGAVASVDLSERFGAAASLSDTGALVEKAMFQYLSSGPPR